MLSRTAAGQSNDMHISVVGIGRLGLPLLVAMASKGFRVVGVDLNDAAVTSVNRGKPHIFEPGVAELLTRHKENISATTDTAAAVMATDMTFIVTATPSLTNGDFSVKYVKQAARNVAQALREKAAYHSVVLTSTVLPGATQGIVSYVEKVSGKRVGRDFGFCYNPEFIAFGTVVADLLNPDFVLIGESDCQAGDTLQRFYERFCDGHPRFARMNYINAELTKIAVNTFVTTKISYANMLAEICEKLEGADVDVVTNALGMDSRIGGKYLRGGPGFGGPCFPRDNLALLYLSQKAGAPSLIAQATQETNRRQNERLVRLLRTLLNERKVLGIVGVSYKPDTDVIENSTGCYIAQAFIGKAAVCMFDPGALEDARQAFEDKVTYVSSLRDCIRGSDVVVVTTPWRDVLGLKPSWFRKASAKVVVDPWRLFKNFRFPSNVRYVPLGAHRGPSLESRRRRSRECC